MFFKRAGLCLVLTITLLKCGYADEIIKTQRIGPGIFGAMYPIAYNPTNPDIIASGSDMGIIYISNDGGRSWGICGNTKDGISPLQRLQT